VGGVGQRSSDPSDGGGGVGKRSVSQCWGGTVRQRSSGGYDGGGADDTGAGDGCQGGEDEELKVEEIRTSETNATSVLDNGCLDWSL
jgi:hypothetical protein